MQLFDEVPRIEGERILLREIVASDAEALGAFARDEDIYRLEPTFLYERRYSDPHVVIERMRAECFDTKDSILLAVCWRDKPDQMLGIAELYAYEERKPKVSLGYRLAPQWWGQGIATEVVGVLKRYLLDEVRMRTITAHVMCQNVASARVMAKNGFLPLYRGVWEDWGRESLVQVDKFIYKRRWEEGYPDPYGKLTGDLP